MAFKIPNFYKQTSSSPGPMTEKTKIDKALAKDSPAKQTQKQKDKTDEIKKINKDTRKPGYVKHPTYTLDGEPLEYNPKYNPENLITDQSKKRDKELMD